MTNIKVIQGEIAASDWSYVTYKVYVQKKYMFNLIKFWKHVGKTFYFRDDCYNWIKNNIPDANINWIDLDLNAG